MHHNLKQHVLSVPITNKVASSNRVHGEVYSMHDRQDITEILLKVALNTINQTKPNHPCTINILLVYPLYK